MSAIRKIQIKYFVCVSILFTCFRPMDAGAQIDASRRREIFVSGGCDHLFRIDDISHDGAGIGAGFGVHLASRLGLEFEFNSMLGLSPTTVPCGAIGRMVGGVIEPLPCVGSARRGLDSFSVGSANVRYDFSDSRVQPFVGGGVGAAWATEFIAISRPAENEVVLSEEAGRNSGFAWNVGGGARIFASPRISIRPEIRFYDSTLLSSLNLKLVRLSVGVGFHW